MRKFIRCGIYNKYYLILFISIIYQIVNEAIYRFNYYENIFDDVKIFHNDGHDYFSKHILIHLTFNYVGLFIFAIPYYIYEIKLEKNDLSFSYSFKKLKKYNDYYFVLLLVLFWVAEEFLFIFYTLILGGLDSWFLELLIVCYLTQKMFDINFYKHHKLALTISSFPLILKYISIILSSILEKKTSNLIYIKHIWMIPVGTLIYLILALIRSFVNLGIKKINDNMLISQNKILMIYGLIGAIITTIFCIFTSIFNCNEGEILNYFCNVSKKNNIYKYIDSFPIYYNTFKGYFNNDKTQIMIEVVVIIFGGITFFINKLLSLKAIKSLNPIIFVYSFPILFLFKKITLIINTLFISKSFFIKDVMGINKLKFYLDMIGDIFYFISFLIYSEIIELNFCQFNYFTRRGIIEDRVPRPEPYYDPYDEDIDDKDDDLLE